MDNYDLDLTKLIDQKPKTIQFPDGQVAKLYKPSMKQLIALALHGKKYKKLDINALDEETILEIVDDLGRILEDIIPEMKGQNLNLEMMTKIMDLIMVDAIPLNNASVEVDNGDIVVDQKKIKQD